MRGNAKIGDFAVGKITGHSVTGAINVEFFMPNGYVSTWGESIVDGLSELQRIFEKQFAEFKARK